MKTDIKGEVPTLYEWAGGMQAFEKLFDKFYDKVLADDVLEPVFKHMSPQHRLHVAHFVAEVLGGPKIYSQSEGSHFEMIKRHLQKYLTEKHRKRWMDLLLETADQLSLPDDPEFRSAFLAAPITEVQLTIRKAPAIVKPKTRKI